MVGSIDLLDCPELTISDERNSIAISCWQDVCLSNIWIPSSLLPSRKKPSNSRVEKGIFHTLQKRDTSKYCESFSVYSEEEIFLSDSDEDILDSCEDIKQCRKKSTDNILPVTPDISFHHRNTNNNEKDILTGKSDQGYRNKQHEYQERNRFSSMKSMPSVDNLCSISAEAIAGVVNSHEKLSIRIEHFKDSVSNQEENRTDSYISLNEILDNTPVFDISNFKNKNDNFMGLQERNLDSNHKKNKKKKKATKHIPLDEFLEDYKEQDYQKDCCNDYFMKLLRERNKTDGVQIRNTAEFPDLAPKELTFIHSKEADAKNPETNFKTLDKILSQQVEINKDANIDNNEEYSVDKNQISDIPQTESISGKFVIENIPNEVCEDDVYAFLCGYGEIKRFSLQCEGKFLKAIVEIDSICDIDWIIECLSGTEPFGAATKPLKCYKQP